ncbi:MAG TPA: hypothetical protein VLD64_08100 [Nitrosarchaeum sp.]|nr:hypothetical protein [Nitrosarchaeum sp.]
MKWFPAKKKDSPDVPESKPAPSKIQIPKLTSESNLTDVLKAITELNNKISFFESKMVQYEEVLSGKTNPPDKAKQLGQRGWSEVPATAKTTQKGSPVPPGPQKQASEKFFDFGRDAKQTVSDLDKRNPLVQSKENVFSESRTKPLLEIPTKELLQGKNEISKLVGIILSSSEDAVKPSVNFEENLWTYPLLEELGTPEHVSSLLEELSSSADAILEKSEYERLPVCPKHPQYISNSIKMYCSSCHSSDVMKLHLIEHTVCGHINTKSGFGENSEALKKCESCNKTIKDPEKELRKLGRWYECKQCKSRFDDLVIKLHCRKFNHDFDINQADIAVIPFYKLKVDAKSVSTYSYSLVPKLTSLKMLQGFTIEPSSTVKGKSGVMHKASIYGFNKENKTILIDIKSSETEIGDSEVNSMLVKVLDTAPSVAILIGIPSVSEVAKTLAASHNISVVTGKEFNEILDSVEQILKSRLFLEKPMDKNLE